MANHDSVNNIKLIECPRDAMQGLKEIISSDTKAVYINQLLKVGFDTIDFGSFVSPKAVPQMKDTADVLKKLNLTESPSKLLAIVANLRGVEDALSFEEISILGFPLSLSETFQKLNTNRTIEEAFLTTAEIQEICQKKQKEFVVYLSMGFGNPYNDPYDASYVKTFIEILLQMGIRTISLSDTVGLANTETITYLFKNLIPAFPEIEFGAHFHTERATAFEKIDTAVKAGCKRFDGALKGFGGCPMAENDLVGNMPTEILVDYFESEGFDLNLNKGEFIEAMELASSVFPAE